MVFKHYNPIFFIRYNALHNYHCVCIMYNLFKVISMNVKELKEILDSLIRTGNGNLEVCQCSSQLTEYTNQIIPQIITDDYYLNENDEKVYKQFLLLI